MGLSVVVRARVRVTEERQAAGDVGPCSYVGCDERAKFITNTEVGHRQAIFYLCAAHRFREAEH